MWEPVAGCSQSPPAKEGRWLLKGKPKYGSCLVTPLSEQASGSAKVALY